ncbi:response regulator [Croceitalea sp. MTPC5]|uniref:response regulator n=1 Tax=Croceitalea sp. MTPC5 TaxID=3056565 RepID=UPI002B3B9590|nr:response regulator [Croceitalea sp. MTPC5]
MGRIKSILLIDDDETTNFLNKLFVKQLDSNLEVNVVLNGKEAIDFLVLNGKEIAPCLIVLDTNMPVMNGWEFLANYEEKFDADFKEKNTVVMLTAVDTEKVVAKAMADPNVDDTAQKPLSDLTFRVLINKHFS